MDEPLFSHPSDEQLNAFVRHAAPAPELLEIDAHLARCPICQQRVQQRVPIASTAACLRAGLDSALPVEHLSEQSIQDAALSGEISADQIQHLESCAICRAEVDDLKRYIAVTPASGHSNRRIWMWAGGAAAALIVLSWQLLPTFNGPNYVATLRDSGGVIALDRTGGLHAPASLPREDAAIMAGVLGSGRFTVPSSVIAARRQELLLGDSNSPAAFTLQSPVGESVASTRPEFSWKAMPGAIAYEVSVYNQGFQKVAHSPILTASRWSGDTPLQAGAVYTWTVTARDAAGREVRVPEPPAPEARFTVLPQDQLDQLSELEHTHGDAHLLLATLYARAGAISEARRHLAALQQANPGSALVQRLAASLPD